jgi:ubiquinone/menaquinone biosynthesis C-methylase UbiE
MSEARLFAATAFTEIYERVLVAPLFRPYAEQLVARLAPHAGDRAIDVACGTGICARLLRERLGPEARIVGVDVAPAKLAVAQTVDPTIDRREGNPTAQPVGTDERFTLLTCHQGLQFMADKPAAVQEMRRVLAPGGRAGIATWSPLEDNPDMLALNAIAERHVGPIADSRHSFGDPRGLERLLIDGGFSEVAVDTFTHGVEFTDGALFARLNAMAVIGMSDKGKAMNDAERSELAGRIVDDSKDTIAGATRDGTFVIRLTSLIATARL